MNKIPYEERVLVYADALKTFGLSAQLVVALEELAEVQKEVCKIMRGKGSMLHLAEEVADATIMLEQIRQIFGINPEVCKFMDEKVARLAGDIQRQKNDYDDKLARIRNLFMVDKTESGLISED